MEATTARHPIYKEAEKKLAGMVPYYKSAVKLKKAVFLKCPKTNCSDPPDRLIAVTVKPVIRSETREWLLVLNA
jgi:hypothetical protein